MARGRLATVTPLRVRPPSADPTQLATLAQSFTDGALACREQRHHAWQSWKVTTRRWGFERVMRCRDCGAERKDDLDRRALVVKRYPVAYPEGYLLAPGTGRVDAEGAAAFRLELLKRG